VCVFYLRNTKSSYRAPIIIVECHGAHLVALIIFFAVRINLANDKRKISKACYNVSD